MTTLNLREIKEINCYLCGKDLEFTYYRKKKEKELKLINKAIFHYCKSCQKKAFSNKLKLD